MKLAELSLLTEMTLHHGKGGLARLTEANRESHRLRLIGAFVLFMRLFSCAGRRPILGLNAAWLMPCPSSPNCVSSDAADSGHLIAAFALEMPAGDAWPAIRESVQNLPRIKIIAETSDYLHADCATAIFGFVDDLELHLRVAERVIAVRSASRLATVTWESIA
jgi:uncharacterized protein (DUF1499 family)